MNETSANEANFTELGRHIERIGTRLRKLDRGSIAYEQGVEDLEDYYERTVQLRQYTIDALTDEVAESRRQHAALKRALRSTAAVLLTLCGVSSLVYWKLLALE